MHTSPRLFRDFVIIIRECNVRGSPLLPLRPCHFQSPLPSGELLCTSLEARNLQNKLRISMKQRKIIHMFRLFTTRTLTETTARPSLFHLNSFACSQIKDEIHHCNHESRKTMRRFTELNMEILQQSMYYICSMNKSIRRFRTVKSK